MPQNRARYHFNKEYNLMLMQLGNYLLAQVGDLKCEPGYQVEPHQQWVDEISLIVSGDAVFEADGKAYEVHKGDLFLNGRHEIHAIRSSKIDPMRMLYLGFDFASPLPNTYAELKSFFDRPTVRIVQGTLEIQQTYMNLLDEIVRRDGFSQILMEGYLNEILCSTFRLAHTEPKNCYPLNDAGGENAKLVHDVILYLETQQGNLDRLQDLSREFGYSYAHIAREFSAVTGESLKAYQTRLRFAQERADMMRGMSVTETAERAGYESIHAFSKAFKKFEGVTASEFLQSVRDQKE